MQFCLVVCDNPVCGNALADCPGDDWIKLGNLPGGPAMGDAVVCSRACADVYLDMGGGDREAARELLLTRWGTGQPAANGRTVLRPRLDSRK